MISGLVFGLLYAKAQAPVANFSATPTTGCSPLAVHFTDQSTNKPLFWTWDFGNGLTSTSQNPTVVYRTPGTYTVKLIVRNTTGTDVAEKNGYITVYAGPTPQFTSNLTLACAPAQVQLLDQSNPGQGSITSWAWNLGDGSASNQENPLHSYTQPGYYNVSLTVTNSGGCSNSITQNRYIRVVNGIQPNFTFNQQSTSCSAPFTGQLLNQSAGPGNLTFNWAVSNGATPANSTDTSPIVTFPTSGQYNVNLQVTSSLGCVASLQQTLPFTNNSVVLNGPTSVCVNTPVIYSEGSSPIPPSISWVFSDGSSFNTPSVSKTFPASGPITVKLINKYAKCVDSISENINVVDVLAAKFTTGQGAACKPPLTVQFTDQTTPAATSWLWDFGDGYTSSQQNPSHTYNSYGQFNVTLTATGPGNCPSTLTKKGAVFIKTPTASIGGILTACVASTASFNTIRPVPHNGSVDGIASYSWNAPGSNEGSSTAALPTFTYPNAGNYTLSVILTTNGGCTASASAGVQIGTPLLPTFTISPGATVCNATPLTFTSTTTPTPQNWIWTFGDHTGNQVTGSPTATYSYAFFGPHEVTLTVSNNGCPQADSQLVNINPPFAHFKDTLAAAGCANRSLIQFNDSSYEGDIAIYGPISWTWDFGDGSPLTAANSQKNPQHQYPAPTATPATYSVTLTVTQGTGANACTSTIKQQVTIGAITASFTPPPPASACRNQQVTFTSTSTPLSLIGTYVWQVDALPTDPPTTSSTFDTSFATNGVHSVTLTVYDLNKCPSVPVTNYITIDGPTAKFTVPATGGGCEKLPAAFTDQSTTDPTTATILSWSWNFGDGGVASGAQNPTHAYADTGYYQPLLTVTDNAGCIDTASRPIQITNPIANFGGIDSFYCPGVPLNFTDSSQGYNLSYLWTFGDPASGASNSSTLPAPAHTFGSSGQTYTVAEQVTDKNNCFNTKTRTIFIQSPTAAFNIYDTTGICTPLQTIFAAHGQYYDSLYWDFGDTTSSTLDSTSHFYNNYGIDTAKLFVQGPGGCLDSASRRVLITNPNTATTMNYSPLFHCDSVPVQFQLVVPNYTTFMLFFGDNAADSSQNLTPFHMYRNPGGYLPEIDLTDPSGCIVGINGIQSITVLGATPFFTMSKHAFCDSSIVQLTDYTISNDGYTNETYTFTDGSPSQTLSPGYGGFNITHDFNQPGSWIATLQVTTHDACTESYADTVHVYQTPHPVMTIPPILCAGPLDFKGSYTPQLTDSITWSWNFGNGETSPLQNPLVPFTPGTFAVKLDASTPFGCIDSAISTITINPSPVIKGPNELTVPLGIPVTIPFTYSPDVVGYQWTPTSNLSCTDCPNPVATVILPTTYTVTVTDANTCSASDTILIKTVCNDKNYWFPNTFSPNGDGVNDYFYPRGTSLYNIQSLTIFNRWGQQVFARMNFPANQQNMGWDGTFGGKPAPADAYVYIAEVICENAQVITISGNITLIR